MSRNKNKSRREAVRVGLVAMKPYKQIAADLGCSESTVKYHASEIYKALGLWGAGARVALVLEDAKKRNQD